MYLPPNGGPKQLLTPSHNMIIGVLLIKFVMVQFLYCTPLTVISAILFLVSVLAYYSFFREHIKLSSYILYFVNLIFDATCCIILGWNFGYSLYIMAAIPIASYYIYLLNSSMEKAASHGGILAMISLAFFTLLRFHVYHNGAFFEYPVTVAYVFSVTNWLLSGLMLLHFCLKFMMFEREMKRALEEKNKELAIISLYDPVTGFRNRQSIVNELKEMLQLAKDINKPFTVVIADMDDYQALKATYGNSKANQVITETSSIISSGVPDRTVLCRWNDDQILMILPLSPENARKCLSHIKKKIDNLEFESGRGNFTVGYTYGIQNLDKEFNTIDDILSAAELAVFNGKQSGKNCISYQNFIWKN